MRGQELAIRYNDTLQRVVCFIALLALLAVPFSNAIGSLLRIWTTSSLYAHGAIAIPVTVALVWVRRSVWDSPSDAGNRWHGLIGLCVCVLANALAASFDIDGLGHLAVAGGIVSAFAICFGSHRTRTLLPALLFLFFMVPVGDGILIVLQQTTAIATAGMLDILGFEAFRQDQALSVGERTFIITEACSGINYLTAALMLAWAASTVYLRTLNGWLSALLVAAALGIASNWLRVTSVIAITVWTDDRHHLAHD
ncbi:MAG: exosortase/archaeosortase family protein, partial [Pseudomonadota bacterium]